MKTPRLTSLALLTIASVIAIMSVFGATNSTATTAPTLPFGISSSDLVFAGVLLGIFFRLTFPYLAAAKAAAATAVKGTTTPFKFDYHYLVIAIGNLVQAGIATALIFQGLPPIAGFLGAFAYGYSSQDITSQFLG